MSTHLTPEQLQRLSHIGVSISNQSIGQIPLQTTTSTPTNRLLPLLSISGLTIFSLGGLFLLKSKTDTSSPSTIQNLPSNISPTQVPKSIQHYLLASQQYFSQALQSQSQNDQNSALQNLNQSILAATESIKLFPTDYRGFYQRSRIYQSLLDSQPQFLFQAISDLSTASRLNPNSADLTRQLASLYAKAGDTQNTLTYLAQTVSLEPTKAQNFYDLARLQQQTGQLPAALDTYNRLLPLLTDLAQKQQVESEKQSLEKLVAQTNPALPAEVRPLPDEGGPSPEISPSPSIQSPLIQAITDSNIIIAAPQQSTDIQVQNQTTSNALSGTLILPANQKQITLSNSNITSLSQVYLTITKGGKNQNLQVLSKSPGSCVIGLDSPIPESIEFRWWIIN